MASPSNAEWIRGKLQDVPLDKKKDVRDWEMQEEEQPTSIFGEDFEMWGE